MGVVVEVGVGVTDVSVGVVKLWIGVGAEVPLIVGLTLKVGLREGTVVGINHDGSPL